MVVHITDKERDGLEDVFSILRTDYKEYQDANFFEKISTILKNFFVKLL